jgi:O-antigen ligase
MTTIKNDRFLPISSYLFLSIPLLLVTGPFLSDLALSLIVIFFLIDVFRNKRFEFFQNNFFFIFCIFYIYIVLNSLFQNQNFDSLKISIGYIRFGIFTLAVVHIVNNNNQILKKLYFVFLFIFSILILDGFIQFYYGQNILGYPLSVGPRVSSLFNDELILGSYLSRFFPIFFALLVFLNKEISKVQYIFSCSIFILAEVLIYLSGERVSFFFMNLSAVFTLLAIKNYKKVRLGILLTSLVLIFIISLTFPNTKQRVFNQTFDQMGLSSDKEITIFSTQHNDLYKTAINITKDNLIFGVGVKNFRNKCDQEKYKISIYSCSTHPHNSYIQLLVELGMIGFFFGFFILSIFFVFIFKHFRYLFKGKYYFTDFQICLISAILISLWPFAPTGNLFNNWLNIVYYFPVGILLWSMKKKTKFDENQIKN